MPPDHKLSRVDDSRRCTLASRVRGQGRRLLPGPGLCPEWTEALMGTQVDEQTSAAQPRCRTASSGGDQPTTGSLEPASIVANVAQNYEDWQVSTARVSTCPDVANRLPDEGPRGRTLWYRAPCAKRQRTRSGSLVLTPQFNRLAASPRGPAFEYDSVTCFAAFADVEPRARHSHLFR